ncbi:major facilitator superfamily domain-containing protein [Lipomyces oligophaga]|uniref:major facilitator superfamily domain-containing protein n=1 Tax=Lipomyces oligophaga TaxID=45792 RepID=UPI0034CD2125
MSSTTATSLAAAELLQPVAPVPMIRAPSPSRARGRNRSRSPHIHSRDVSGADFHHAYVAPEPGSSSSSTLEVDLERVVSTATSGIEPDVELGVHKAEVLSQTWTRNGLHCAYVGLFLLAFTTSLSGQVTALLTPFATSEFHVHSLLAMVQVVQGILFAVVKTPMAKIANAFGRLEAFFLAILLLSVGYFQMAAAGGVAAYSSAQIFSASGTTGLLILQQIFVADTTDLLNRALFSVLPDTPFLITVWIAPAITDITTEKFTWRYGYSMWVLLVPLAASPLLITLFQNQRRARQLGLLPKHDWSGQTLLSVAKSISNALDIIGIILLTAACAMVLIPLTLSSTTATHWHDGRIWGLLIGGTVLFFVFVGWELYLATLAEANPYDTTRLRPLLSLRVLKNRTVLAGCVTIFFYDMAYNVFQPYFFSYLMITRPISTDSAGKIVQVFSFAATASGIAVSLLIKWSGRYKRWLLIGIPLYALGILTMHYSRVPGSHNFFIVLSQLIAGIGGGSLSLPSQIGVQASCNHADVALATAMFLTVFSLGSAVGASVSGAIWTTLLPKWLSAALPEDMQDEVSKIYADFGYARRAYPDLGSPERQAIAGAYKDVMSILIWVAVSMVIPAFFSALFMTEYDLEELSKMVADQSGGNYSYGILNKTDDDDDAIERTEEDIRLSTDVHMPIIIGSNSDRTDDGDAIEVLSSDEEEDALNAGVGDALSHDDLVQDPLRVGRQPLL